MVNDTLFLLVTYLIPTLKPCKVDVLSTEALDKFDSVHNNRATKYVS